MDKRLSRLDLVKMVRDDFPTLAAAERAVDSIIDGITNMILNGDELCIKGFGAFTIQERKPRRGRNMRTGETISVPAKRVVKFVPGKSLKSLSTKA